MFVTFLFDNVAEHMVIFFSIFNFSYDKISDLLQFGLVLISQIDMFFLVFYFKALQIFNFLLKVSINNTGRILLFKIFYRCFKVLLNLFEVLMFEFLSNVSEKVKWKNGKRLFNFLKEDSDLCSNLIDWNRLNIGVG